MDGRTERFAIACARDGSQEAWKQLFAWHFDAVYQFCLVLTGGRQDLSEEASQQVFVTAARRIGRFRAEQGTFRAWLHGIAQHRYLTLHN